MTIPEHDPDDPRTISAQEGSHPGRPIGRRRVARKAGRVESAYSEVQEVDLTWGSAFRIGIAIAVFQVVLMVVAFLVLANTILDPSF